MLNGGPWIKEVLDSVVASLKTSTDLFGPNLDGQGDALVRVITNNTPDPTAINEYELPHVGVEYAGHKRAVTDRRTMGKVYYDVVVGMRVVLRGPDRETLIDECERILSYLANHVRQEERKASGQVFGVAESLVDGGGLKIDGKDSKGLAVIGFYTLTLQIAMAATA